MGYCLTTESCGVPSTAGGGDANELSNEKKNEIIRLTLPRAKVWTDIELSSLDTGGTSSNESGTLYWSSSATPILLSSSSIGFSHNGLGWSAGTVEGSIFGYLVAHGFDVHAPYLFFRAGTYDWLGVSTHGTNNDFLVWGVNVAALIPEPETYAMLLAGLGLLGFAARRRKQKETAAG